MALDLTIRAPARMFVRGRGLDAEFGGQLRLGGTTSDVVPQGQFDLVRGRLDILGRRLALDQGLVRLQGSFDPYIRIVATTEAEDITVRIALEGFVSDPEIRIESSPELPEDEVLARLFFGKGLTELSPIQAVRLASAVAELSGRGGGGIVNRLRENFGLDDLDVTTDAAGNAAVRAGRYISENVYTEVTVGSEGTADISINLDISRSFTAKGSVDSDGDTSIGVFFERDY
jgi:translocation and assembly module TamB